MLRQKEALQLFEDYTYYREHTAYFKSAKQKNPYLRPLKATQERLRLFDEMAEWCRQRDLPPREWLYSLFDLRSWNFAPKLEQGHLQAEKQIPKFKKTNSVNFTSFSKRIRRLCYLERLGNPEQGFDPNRDLNHSTEQAKQYYLKQGGAKECRDHMLGETFGFHPKSAICNKCADKDTCLTELQSNVSFDILALRRGLITSRQAQQQAFMGQTNDG